MINYFLESRWSEIYGPWGFKVKLVSTHLITILIICTGHHWTASFIMILSLIYIMDPRYLIWRILITSVIHQWRIWRTLLPLRSLALAIPCISECRFLNHSELTEKLEKLNQNSRRIKWVTWNLFMHSDRF